MGVFLGIFNWTFIGQEVSFNEPQWGQALWALILAAIWFWVAAGFWGVRAYAWSFGVFISLFTLIWGFFAVLFGSSIEQETVPWLLAGIIYLYLQYPGVRQHFEKSELDRLTPEQRAAYEQLMAANAAAAQAKVTAAAPAPAPQAPAPSVNPPAPPSDTSSPGA
jgi:predicted membrane-bound mannosyltransferase